MSNMRRLHGTDRRKLRIAQYVAEKPWKLHKVYDAELEETDHHDINSAPIITSARDGTFKKGSKIFSSLYLSSSVQSQETADANTQIQKRSDLSSLFHTPVDNNDVSSQKQHIEEHTTPKPVVEVRQSPSERASMKAENTNLNVNCAEFRPRALVENKSASEFPHNALPKVGNKTIIDPHRGLQFTNRNVKTVQTKTRLPTNQGYINSLQKSLNLTIGNTNQQAFKPVTKHSNLSNVAHSSRHAKRSPEIIICTPYIVGALYSSPSIDYGFAHTSASNTGCYGLQIGSSEMSIPMLDRQSQPRLALEQVHIPAIGLQSQESPAASWHPLNGCIPANVISPTKSQLEFKSSSSQTTDKLAVGNRSWQWPDKHANLHAPATTATDANHQKLLIKYGLCITGTAGVGSRITK